VPSKEGPDPTDRPSAVEPEEHASRAARRGLEGAFGAERSGLLPGFLAGLCLLVVILTARTEIAAIGRIFVPAAGILAAWAFGQVLVRRHPDENWLAWALVVGVAVKLLASALRYYTVVDEYGGLGDATLYDQWGRRYFESWTSGSDEPDPTGKGSAETNWLRWFTGVVYFIFGPDIITGFLVFGLFAVVGSYLWYRAAAEAVPFLDKRLFFALVFFVPSIAFWPSSIGKESLMQLGVGGLALGTALVFRQRLLRGLLVALPFGWLVWRVRPHLLAIVVFAAGVAYLLGRVRKSAAPTSMSLTRPIGMVIVVILVFFAISEGAEFLGMEQFSLDAVEEQLQENEETTAQGGSQFESGGSTLTPLTLPEGVMTVLLRPFPWEVQTSLQILASLEGVAIAVFILWRLRSVALSLRRARTTPFLMYCWTLILLYAVAFSSIANFGLLVRQRSLAFPAMFVIVALDLKRAQADERHTGDTTSPVVANRR
jgi:hypothetical protein